LEAIAATGRFVSGAYFFRGRTGRQPGEHNRQSAEFQNGVTHGMWHSFVRCDEAHPKALNQSLTLPMHIRGMTLYAADGSSFSWEIANSAVGGFDATFRTEQSVSGEAYSEATRTTRCPEKPRLDGFASKRQCVVLTLARLNDPMSSDGQCG
jgi:hypothetical protein